LVYKYLCGINKWMFINKKMQDTLKRFLSLFIWMIWYCIVIPLTLLVLFLSLIIPRKAYDPMLKIYCFIVVCSAWMIPIVKNHIKGKMPFPVIYVANHVSFFDLFICGCLLPGSPRGIQLKEHFKIPFYGWVISRFGEIPMDTTNNQSIKRSFMNAIDILKRRERNLLIMPEGERTKTGKVGTFKSGAFYLSRKANLPIVPVIFKGLFERNNRNSFVINPGIFYCIIMPPVYPGQYETDSEFAEHVKKLIVDELEKS